MTTVYASDIVNAAADIAAAGTALTFTRNTSTYNPATDGSTPSTSTSSSVAIGVKSNWQKFQAMGLSISTPQTLKVAASGMTFDPLPGDTFVWNGFVYAVVNVETLAPDGTPILYTVIGNR
jgi:hypothetical protein